LLVAERKAKKQHEPGHRNQQYCGWESYREPVPESNIDACPAQVVEGDRVWSGAGRRRDAADQRTYARGKHQSASEIALSGTRAGSTQDRQGNRQHRCHGCKRGNPSGEQHADAQDCQQDPSGPASGSLQYPVNAPLSKSGF